MFHRTKDFLERHNEFFIGAAVAVVLPIVLNRVFELKIPRVSVDIPDIKVEAVQV